MLPFFCAPITIKNMQKKHTNGRINLMSCLFELLDNFSAWKAKKLKQTCSFFVFVQSFHPTVTWCAHLWHDEGSLGAPGSGFQSIRMYPATPLSCPACEKGSLVTVYVSNIAQMRKRTLTLRVAYPKFGYSLTSMSIEVLSFVSFLLSGKGYESFIFYVSLSDHGGKQHKNQVLWSKILNFVRSKSFFQFKQCKSDFVIFFIV